MNQDASLTLFTTMIRIRSFEERVGELFLQGGSAGTMLHLSIGEEGGAAGVGLAMHAGDTFTTHHRGHGIFLARGGDPKRMMAEIAGREAGYCRGKGGSMHIADMSLGHLGANAIVGGGIPTVVGAALSHQMQDEKKVSVAFFGDGALQQGVLYESMNLAALWNLPAMFVCINNQYGMGTRIDQASANLDFAQRGCSFGLLSEEVDGSDAEAVYRTAGALLAQARAGRPAFLTVHCYRFYGHARKDKSPYRSAEEEQAGRAKDPIALLEKQLLEAGTFSEVHSEAIKREAEEEMDQALEFALNAPEPELKSMFEDVYAPEEKAPVPVKELIAS